MSRAELVLLLLLMRGGNDVIINAGDKEFVELREIIPQLH